MGDEGGATQSNEVAAVSNVPRRSGVIPSFRHYIQQHRAYEDKLTPTDRAARSTARATWVIAFLTVAAIGVGLSQYIIFDRQLKAMQSQLDLMYRDQIPRFTLSKELPLPHFDVSQGNLGHIFWSIPFDNIGKGAAIELSASTYIALDGGPFVRSDPAFRADPVDLGEQAPGTGGYLTISSAPIVKSQFDYLKTKDKAIAVTVEFSYLDELGKSYKKKLCSAMQANGAIQISEGPGCGRTKAN